MTRRLLTLLAVLSLALFVATVALWVRSYRVSDRVGRLHYTPSITSEGHHVYLRTTAGTAVIVGGGDPADNFSNIRWSWERLEPWPYPFGRDAPPWLRAVGIGWENEKVLETGERTWGAQVSLAWPASLSCLAASILALSARRLGPSRPDRCPRCGYDLRASPGRCPECGTPTN